LVEKKSEICSGAKARQLGRKKSTRKAGREASVDDVLLKRKKETTKGKRSEWSLQAEREKSIRWDEGPASSQQKGCLPKKSQRGQTFAGRTEKTPLPASRVTIFATDRGGDAGGKKSNGGGVHGGSQAGEEKKARNACEGGVLIG